MHVAVTSPDEAAVDSSAAAPLARPRPARAPAPDPADHHVAPILLEAVRRLLRAESAADVREAVAALVRRLGATLEPPTASGRGQLPVDLSFGGDAPLVPTGDAEALARLSEVLPRLTSDASVAFERIVRSGFLVTSATVDPLTRVGNRRVAVDVLGRLAPGDVVVMVDFDHFKALNDTRGHDAGDAVLRSFGEAAASVVRADDSVVRLGGEEFGLFLPRTSVDQAVAVVERLRAHWPTVRPHPISFSAGIAPVDARGAKAALQAADEAMYRAKADGRDRVVVHLA